MWIMDLEKAVQKIKEEKKHEYFAIEEITPCADGGISFKTSRNTVIKWYPNNEIKETPINAWRQKAEA